MAAASQVEDEAREAGTAEQSGRRIILWISQLVSQLQEGGPEAVEAAEFIAAVDNGRRGGFGGVFDPRIALGQSSALISLLVTMVKSESDKGKTAAVAALMNIAHNDKNKGLIAQAGARKELTALLRNGSERWQAEASPALQNFTVVLKDDVSNESEASAAGGLSKLGSGPNRTDYLSDSSDDETWAQPRKYNLAGESDTSDIDGESDISEVDLESFLCGDLRERGGYVTGIADDELTTAAAADHASRFDALVIFPAELWEKIFSFLDAQSCGTARRLFHSARRIFSESVLLQPLIGAMLAHSAVRGAASVHTVFDRLYADQSLHDLSVSTKSRLKLFKSTVAFLKSAGSSLAALYDAAVSGACVSTARLPSTASMQSYVAFLQNTRDILQGLLDDVVLRQVPRVLGEGFDMADLALWRYCLSFEERVKNASAVMMPTILHPEANQWWAEHWGADTYSVPFEKFYKRLEETVLLRSDRKKVSIEFEKFIQVFLNFPKDDCMTSFKFNLLDQTLGPLSCLASNFDEIVLKPGFVGLVNRERATELLEDFIKLKRPAKPIFVLRFSRTKPEGLVETIGIKDDRTQELRFSHHLLRRSTIGEGLISREKIATTLRPTKALPLPVRVDNITAALAAQNVVHTAYEFEYGYLHCGAPVKKNERLSVSNVSDELIDECADATRVQAQEQVGVHLPASLTALSAELVNEDQDLSLAGELDAQTAAISGEQGRRENEVWDDTANEQAETDVGRPAI